MTYEESLLQAECVKRLSQVADIWFFMIKNDGSKNMRQAMRDKAMGLHAGTADFAVIGPDGITTYLEFKTKDGKLSASQEKFKDFCISHGTPYMCVRSIFDIDILIKESGWKLKTFSTIQKI